MGRGPSGPALAAIALNTSSGAMPPPRHLDASCHPRMYRCTLSGGASPGRAHASPSRNANTDSGYVMPFAHRPANHRFIAARQVASVAAQLYPRTTAANLLGLAGTSVSLIILSLSAPKGAQLASISSGLRKWIEPSSSSRTYPLRASEYST